MKRIISLFALTALTFAGAEIGSAATVADYPAGTTANGIAGSRHNLGSLGKVITTNNTTEICVFCHTPHHTNTSNNLKPLWNRGTAAPSAYTAYGTTLGGTTIVSSDIGSTTLACLSCHDGVTTFDNIINTPGKGGTTATNLSWNFNMPGIGSWYPGSPALDHFNTDAMGPCATCHGAANPATRLSLQQNLTNDHPVSVAYNPSVAGLRATSTVINSIDLTAELAASAASYNNSNLAQNRWAVKGYISDTATIGDLLRNNKVECSSCHDPHFKNLSWDEVESSWAINPQTGNPWNYCAGPEDCSDGQFLRRVGGNTGSGVCRTCHNK
ncbi:MAG: hypothetical protein HYS21_01355 [Deltaproteobacteria bacterium]|nr:hypothetical protein [Deltaproteobacteria bacterium]